MQTKITYTELMEMKQHKRAHLVNSTGGFKSVCLVGTADQQANANLAIFSSIVHIGTNPPLICFIIRPGAADGHTLSNILSTGVYTINHINENIYRQAHQTSARYPKDVAEFDATGLTREYKDGWPAPSVKESTIQLAIELKEHLELTINNSIMVIGLIRQVYFPEDCLCDDGYIDIEKAGTLSCTGLDSYHTTHRLQRLNYAKP